MVIRPSVYSRWAGGATKKTALGFLCGSSSILLHYECGLAAGLAWLSGLCSELKQLLGEDDPLSYALGFLQPGNQHTPEVMDNLTINGSGRPLRNCDVRSAGVGGPLEETKHRRASEASRRCYLVGFQFGG